MKTITTGKAAEMAGVSRETIRQWFDDGKIKGRRVGGWRQIFLRPFELFLEKNTRNARNTTTSV